MQNLDDKEVVELIKATLDGYEEEYIPGAWEGFLAKRRKKKRIILWSFGTGIAASLLVGWFGLNLVHQGSFNGPVDRGSAIVLNENSNDTIRKNSVKDPGSIQSVAPTVIFKSTKNITEKNISARNTTSHILYSNVFNENKISENLSQADTLKENPSEIIDDPVTTTLIASSDSSRPQLTEQVYNQPTDDHEMHSGTKRKIRFGLNFSPGVNSAGTASTFNYSAGINTDFNLFGNLQFSTGLQIEHQSVVSGNSTPEVRTEAELLNLDLPMNIKWKFFSGKSKNLYVSGGVSSLAYLGEKSTSTTYKQELVEISTMAKVAEAGVQALSYDIVKAESVEEKSGSPSQTIDFAGRLNILFGMEQQITSRLSLHIEPYMKIPISRLASQNLKFTTSGITCKISF